MFFLLDLINKNVSHRDRSDACQFIAIAGFECKGILPPLRSAASAINGSSKMNTQDTLYSITITITVY